MRINGDTSDDVYLFSGDSMVVYTLDVGVHGSAPVKIKDFFKGNPAMVALISNGIDAASSNPYSPEKGGVLLFKNEVAIVANILTGQISGGLNVWDITSGRFNTIDAIILTNKYWHFYDASGRHFQFFLSSDRPSADVVGKEYKPFTQTKGSQCAVENCQQCVTGSTEQCAKCNDGFHSLETWCHNDAIISHLDFNKADSQYWDIYADAANSQPSGEFVTAQLNNGLLFKVGNHVTMKKPTISPLGEFRFSVYFKPTALGQTHVLMRSVENLCPPLGQSQGLGAGGADAKAIELSVGPDGSVQFNYCGFTLTANSRITTNKYYLLAVSVQGQLYSVAVNGVKRETTRSEKALNSFRPVFDKWGLCPVGTTGCNGVLDQVEFRGSAPLGSSSTGTGTGTGGSSSSPPGSGGGINVNSCSVVSPVAAIVLAAIFALLL